MGASNLPTTKLGLYLLLRFICQNAILTQLFCFYTKTSVGFGLKLVPLFVLLFCFGYSVLLVFLSVLTLLPVLDMPWIDKASKHFWPLFASVVVSVLRSSINVFLFYQKNVVSLINGCCYQLLKTTSCSFSTTSCCLQGCASSEMFF